MDNKIMSADILIFTRKEDSLSIVLVFRDKIAIDRLATLKKV